MNPNTPQDEQRVEIQFDTSEDDAVYQQWFPGTVIKARKLWVLLDSNEFTPDGFVADENIILDWRPITSPPH